MVLAHQGGWDEVLLVLGPILVIGLLLRLAKHRADRALAARSPGEARSAGDAPEHHLPDGEATGPNPNG